MASETPVNQRLMECGELHLPTIREVYEDLVRHAVQESWGYEQFLCELVERGVSGAADKSDGGAGFGSRICRWRRISLDLK